MTVIELIKAIKSDPSKLKELIDFLDKKTILTINDTAAELDTLDFENLTKALEQNLSITKLEMDLKKIGIKSIKPFIVIAKRSLTPRMKLRGFNITFEEVELLSEALENKPNLTHLDLGQIHIGAKGIKALIPAFKSRPIQH